MVANLVYGRYNDAAPIVAQEIVRQEAGFFTKAASPNDLP